MTPDELTKLFDACPNIGWRVFLPLCRVAGLRRGEALDASWDDVDWNHQRLAVIAKKTGKKRVVPIEPNLHDLLIEMWESAEPGETFIVPRDMVSRSSVRTRFQSIIKAAGLEQWQVYTKSSAETEKQIGRRPIRSTSSVSGWDIT